MARARGSGTASGLDLDASSVSGAPQPPAIAIPAVPAHTYVHHTTLVPRPKLIVVGDSITELGSSHAQGWVASLAIRYNRRMDVLNRGMNGYNSRWGMAALPLILEEIIGPPSCPNRCDGDSAARCSSGGDCIEEDSPHEVGGQSQSKKLKTNHEGSCDDDNTRAEQKQKDPSHAQYNFFLAYGANDSCLPSGASSRHHVPLKEYSSNLKRMVRMIQTWNADKSVAVALLTPPPCDTERQKGSRDNENITRLYAESCIRVAIESGVPWIDLWTGMQQPVAKNKDEQPSFERSYQWKSDYLSDGLHLTPMGNFRLYELAVGMLDRPSSFGRESLSEKISGLGLSTAELPRSYPDHKLVDGEDPTKSFGMS